ncbi:hypothetical protein QJS66_17440 [Kocuria rhizophila]|nr:hypothetical protein QJS66_17440 [Kocuria rhizophila]
MAREPADSAPAHRRQGRTDTVPRRTVRQEDSTMTRSRSSAATAKAGLQLQQACRRTGGRGQRRDPQGGAAPGRPGHGGEPGGGGRPGHGRGPPSRSCCPAERRGLVRGRGRRPPERTYAVDRTRPSARSTPRRPPG